VFPGSFREEREPHRQGDLAGMQASLCVESHLRELLEQSFEIAVVMDATAAPGTPRSAMATGRR